jgi:6-phosphogluconolactonase
MTTSPRSLSPTRRALSLALAGLVLSAGLSSTTASAAAQPLNAPAATQTGLVYVGMHGTQLRAMRFDSGTGKLSMVGPVAEGLKPTWAVAHPQLPVLYVVDDDKEKGSVVAFTVNRDTGALAKLNEAATGGNGTTNLWLDAASSTLLTANFGGGSASSIALNPDGSLGALVSTIKATGSGPHRRQASAHAHGVAIDPSGRYALVPDLGADRLFVYGFDRTTHALASDGADHPRAYTAPPGSGPRHIAFSPNGRFVYLLSELTAEITTLRWDPQAPQLTPLQTLETTAPDFKGAKSGAEVAVSRDGRFVYVENRGENTLVVYRINSDTGELTFTQRISSGGEVPWGFGLHPSGKWLLVANERSGKVNVFGIDPASGMLSDTGQALDTPAPVSITFVN